MSLLNTKRLDLQIATLTTRQSRNGLSPAETRELQQLLEFSVLLPIAQRAIKQIVHPRFRDEVESAVIMKYLELRSNGNLDAVPPAAYVRRMVQTALANIHRQDRRSAGWLNDDQVHYPVDANTSVTPVAMVSDNTVTDYDYADVRHTTETVDSWLDNYTLVSGYFQALINEFDKVVLWALWLYKGKPQELARQLGCEVTLVYAAIRRLRSHSKAGRAGACISK